MEISPEQKNKIFKAVLVLLVILCVYFAVKIISEIGQSDKNGDKTQNIITLTGHGEVQAVPDIATADFTIRKEAKIVKDAQAEVAKVEKKALEILKADKIDSKDIKTVNTSFNPKYEYKYDGAVVCLTNVPCPPPVGRNVITGYEAYESITVKIRNTDDAGKIIQELGTIGITELSGPNFAIDKEDALKAEARKEAIDDAKTKAKALAKDLGVRLGHIASFNESGNYPVPMYAKAMSADVAGAAPAPAELPKGENTISSDVTITYEIK